MASNRPELSLAIGARSEKGLREENQDKMTAFQTPLGMLHLVADGMGGHRGGAMASHLVLEGYRNHLGLFVEGTDPAVAIESATASTNREIFDESRLGDSATAGMGSTVVMALLTPGPAGPEMRTAHVGDSRAYLVRNGSILQLTRDHSVVQRMVDENVISAEAARTHPDLNVLTRAIGKQAEVQIDVNASRPLLPGDIVLLCTDGLWGHVPEETLLAELMVPRSASEAADALVERALNAGSDDNITLQILRLEEKVIQQSPLEDDSLSRKAGMPWQRRITREMQPLTGVAAPGSVWRKLRQPRYAAMIAFCMALAAGAALFFYSHQKKNQARHPCPPGSQTAPCKPFPASNSTVTAPKEREPRPPHSPPAGRPSADQTLPQSNPVDPVEHPVQPKKNRSSLSNRQKEDGWRLG